MPRNYLKCFNLLLTFIRQYWQKTFLQKKGTTKEVRFRPCWLSVLITHIIRGPQDHKKKNRGHSTTMWTNFDHLPTGVYNFRPLHNYIVYIMLTLFVQVTKCGLSTEQLPTSFCSRSYWMTIYWRLFWWFVITFTKKKLFPLCKHNLLWLMDKRVFQL